MYVIKNITPAVLMIDGVEVNPGEQLDVATLSNSMQDAADAGALQIKSGDTTQAERHADVLAIEAGINEMDKLL